MKRVLVFFLVIPLLITLLPSCASSSDEYTVVATTLPVYEITKKLFSGTDVQVKQLITENISCLHDYTLHVNQMRALEKAAYIVISGAGLESSIGFALSENVIDASVDIPLKEVHNHSDHTNPTDHRHEHDPHFWLNISCFRIMAETVYKKVITLYPTYADVLQHNYLLLEDEITSLESYANNTLQNLKTNQIITFHNGFSYMADCFHLEILKAIEEESGSEASAKELKEIIHIVRMNSLPAIFTEKNGATSAATVISSETGARIYSLDMAISGNSYFDAMYYNINTLKEALG